MIKKIIGLVTLLFYFASVVTMELPDACYPSLIKQANQLQRQQYQTRQQQQKITQLLAHTFQQLNRTQQLVQQTQQLQIRQQRHLQRNLLISKIFFWISTTPLLFLGSVILRQKWKYYCWQKKYSAQLKRNQSKQTQDKRDNSKPHSNLGFLPT